MQSPEANNEKELLEKQFKELSDKAKAMYPDINDAIAIIDNSTKQSIIINEYLDLSAPKPYETSSNQINLV